jgi:hypothetical protein
MTGEFCRAFLVAACGVAGLGLAGMAMEEWSINKPMAVSMAADTLVPFSLGALLTSLPKNAFEKEAPTKPSGPKPS